MFEKETLLEGAQHIIDTMAVANERGDEFNAVASLSATFRSYVRLYKKLTGNDLVVVNGKVEEVTA